MKTAIRIAFAISILVLTGGKASADAELRLYEGDHDWDLKDRLVIRSRDGSTFDYQYNKVCGAYTGCKAVQANSDEDAKLAQMSPTDLAALEAAIGSTSAVGTQVSVTATKPSLCKQFRHFVYEIKNGAGASIQVEDIRNCVGVGLSGPSTQTIERILNKVAEDVGL